jgi:DNA-binding transcriptional MerR regulator
MYTVSKLARQFGLSRSTLLYYDRIGLLRPSGRSPGDYRLYAQEDCDRLEQICQLRQTGLPLKRIAELLDGTASAPQHILKQRLTDLNREIAELRQQQQAIVKLLGDPHLSRGTRLVTHRTWVAMLETAGLDQAGRRRWHQEFEQHAPEAHQDFLESLGFSAAEIKRIRSASRTTSRHLPSQKAPRVSEDNVS